MDPLQSAPWREYALLRHSGATSSIGFNDGRFIGGKDHIRLLVLHECAHAIQGRAAKRAGKTFALSVWAERALERNITTTPQFCKGAPIHWTRAHAQLFQTIYGILRCVYGYRIADTEVAARTSKCRQCDKPIPDNRKHIGRRPEFCSAGCKQKAYRERQKEERTLPSVVPPAPFG